MTPKMIEQLIGLLIGTQTKILSVAIAFFTFDRYSNAIRKPIESYSTLQ